MWEVLEEGQKRVNCYTYTIISEEKKTKKERKNASLEREVSLCKWDLWFIVFFSYELDSNFTQWVIFCNVIAMVMCTSLKTVFSL